MDKILKRDLKLNVKEPSTLKVNPDSNQEKIRGLLYPN